MSRQQRRVIHKLTGEELNEIIEKSRFEGIGVAIQLFADVMKEEFGFGAVRIGRIAQAVHKKLEEED